MGGADPQRGPAVLPGAAGSALSVEDDEGRDAAALQPVRRRETGLPGTDDGDVDAFDLHGWLNSGTRYALPVGVPSGGWSRMRRASSLGDLAENRLDVDHRRAVDGLEGVDVDPAGRHVSNRHRVQADRIGAVG
jgi:hypothetical protein